MRETVVDANAPPSSSPVAQAVKGGGLVFVGGQMPRDMSTGNVVEGAGAQARLSLKHCASILDAAGSGMDRAMLAIVYVTDLAAKHAVNEAFSEAFGDSPPARNLVEVSEIGEGAIVEIGIIALQ